MEEEEKKTCVSSIASIFVLTNNIVEEDISTILSVETENYILLLGLLVTIIGPL
jgi:hypothetical protein